MTYIYFIVALAHSQVDIYKVGAESCSQAISYAVEELSDAYVASDCIGLTDLDIQALEMLSTPLYDRRFDYQALPESH